MPASLYGRAADNWRPLIAIADLAGSEWPARARRVAERLGGQYDDLGGPIAQAEPKLVLWGSDALSAALDNFFEPRSTLRNKWTTRKFTPPYGSISKYLRSHFA